MRFKEYKQYRLPNYDYSGKGIYFVTINVKNREEKFGKVNNGKMILSEIGVIAENIWKKLPQKFPNITLDEFQLMPDHMHGIINIVKYTNGNIESRNTPQHVIKTLRRVPTDNNLQPLVKNSLSSIINHYKGSVTLWCKNNGYPDFKWQARFFDRVIRDNKELFAMRAYIKYNPKRWDEK